MKIKIIPLLLPILLVVGCAKNEIVDCSVTWYDDTVTPKRELAQYDFELTKGQNALLGLQGIQVQFGEEHKVKVRFFWNNKGIFTEVYSKAGNDWESKILKLDPKSVKSYKFKEGIIAEAVVKK